MTHQQIEIEIVREGVTHRNTASLVIAASGSDRKWLVSDCTIHVYGHLTTVDTTGTQLAVLYREMS